MIFILICKFINFKIFLIKFIREYSVQRLIELQKEKLNNFKNDCGGNFFEDNWISAFPTDSQVFY